MIQRDIVTMFWYMSTVIDTLTSLRSVLRLDFPTVPNDFNDLKLENEYTRHLEVKSL